MFVSFFMLDLCLLCLPFACRVGFGGNYRPLPPLLRFLTRSGGEVDKKVERKNF